MSSINNNEHSEKLSTNEATTGISENKIHPEIDTFDTCEIDENYKHIVALKEILTTNDLSAFQGAYPLIDPIEINSLEMIEAELANQGFTSLDIAALKRSRRKYREAAGSNGVEQGLFNRSEFCLSIAQRAAVETSLWRWRARRINKKATNFRFFVQVHYFLLKWASELSSALQYKQSADVDGGERLFLHRPGLIDTFAEDRNSILKKLQYLDEIAAFLLNQKDREDNPYQKGLDVVLKVLTLPGRNRGDKEYSIEPINLFNDSLHEPISLCLPLNRETFFKELKRTTLY